MEILNFFGVSLLVKLIFMWGKKKRNTIDYNNNLVFDFRQRKSIFLKQKEH